MSSVDPNARTAIDVANARQNAKLDVAVVRDFIHGGRDQWEMHSEIVDIMSSDSIFDKSRRLFMTRSELYKRSLAMTSRVEELRQRHNWSLKETNHAIGLCDDAMPINLHNIAFEPVVLSQGSSELIAKYGKLIAYRGILGCYLQTELGHGTNVSQLETTATYIPDSQEFEINSPTVTSTKWWIGALGKTATHGVVQARLILPGGKDIGPHLFLVQLRSLADHTALPGISIGDIGPKAMAGMSANDNGFARFDHVRIPRENMLSKFAQVTTEGQYIKPPHAKLSYGGMLYIRSTMIGSAGHVLARAATVAIRYATVRRQGNKAVDGLERQVITYPSLYYRLLPILSRAYVFILIGRQLSRAFLDMSNQLASGDTSQLAEMHATTSGLKVLVSTLSTQDIETARRSMGGHGYSAFAGLGKLYADHLPSATYEGDNFVLDQQVVRAAIKSCRNVISAKESGKTFSLSPSSAYLRLLDMSLPQETISDAAWRDPATSILLLEWRAALMVQARSHETGPLDASVDQRVSRAVTEAFTAAQVRDILHTLPLQGDSGNIIHTLFLLYFLVTVESALVDILSFGLLRTDVVLGSYGSDPTKGLRLTIDQCCRALLSEAISLTDAFGFTDWELDSALGGYDGRVYEALWNSAQQEPLNETAVPDGYNEFIKPMLERGQKLAGLVNAKAKL